MWVLLKQLAGGRWPRGTKESVTSHSCEERPAVDSASLLNLWVSARPGMGQEGLRGLRKLKRVQLGPCPF